MLIQLTPKSLKQIVISRAIATLLMLQSLKPSQFNFASYVKKANTEHTCGTICCTAGWYPQYFPETELKYRESYMPGIGLTLTTKYRNSDNVCGVLSEYHGLKPDVINYMFYAEDYPTQEEFNDLIKEYLPRLQPNSPLSKLIEAWEKLIDLIETGTDEQIELLLLKRIK